MNEDISKTQNILHRREADAHGQAAMLLVESLIHGLIEKKVLSPEEAIEIVDLATEVKIETGTEQDEPPATLQMSIDLLQNISASLRFDVGGSTPDITDQIAVLVVEDEALILMDIVAQLQSEGFKAYEATNADAAVELLEAHADIRLIFTDIDMPGSMDGLKLAAAVRDRWPPVKIIITSGRHVVGEADMPEGTVFFGKPYDHVTVAQSMRQMLKS